MIILHVVSDLTTGGAELMLKRLVTEHAGSRRYQHHVISLKGLGSVGPQLQALGIPVEALGSRGPLSAAAALWRLVARIRELKPDIIQTWMYHSDLLGGIAARLAGRRNVIWGVRATHIPPGRGTSPLTTLLRRVCAALSRWIPKRIVYVANAARSVHEGLGYDCKKSLVIANGYNLPSVAAGPAARLSLRRKLGIPDDALLVGTAGRFNALKDFPTFITAASSLAPAHPNLHFLMLGRQLDRDNGELMAWIRAGGSEARFHLMGEQRELDHYLAGLDIFCLHSISEGFPNIVAEAMAVGVPCVVTDVGDAAFLVAESGLVVPSRAPDRIAAAVEQLIAEGEAGRAQRGMSARERVLTHFSMAAIAARYEALYHDLAGSGQGAAEISPKEKLGPSNLYNG